METEWKGKDENGKSNQNQRIVLMAGPGEAMEKGIRNENVEYSLYERVALSNSTCEQRA